MGQRLGTPAADSAMAGYTDSMISEWPTESVLVPPKLAILARKRRQKQGILWTSVVAKARQPSSLNIVGLFPGEPPED